MISQAQETALEEIEQLFKRKGQHSHRFVVYQDLEALWAAKLATFSKGAGLRLTDVELRQVQQHQLRILSTLICIGWETLRDFRQDFVQTKCYDDKLPLASNSPELKHLSSSRRTQFEETQYIFNPVELGPSGLLRAYSERQRLPFVQRSEMIGCGSYGDVFKEVIAAKHLYTDNLSGPRFHSDTECCVARKELRETNAANEIRNLRHIQCSLVSHERIIQHLAMYKVGSLCNIIFPLADTDLGKFLELPQYEKQFDAPRYIERFISEAAHLAGAVEFLHGSLERPDETNSFCCHMDLKTDNILVFLRDDGSFQWKITDFGISRIKPDPKKPVTLGELVDRLATKTRARRSGGEFQAPEMHMERYVGRKSDVWSLGCILIKVIIRGIIGATRLGEFDASRRTNEFFDDYFYDGPNLKFPVQRWLDQLCDGRGEYMGMLCSGLGFEQPQAEAILSECHMIISWSLNHDPKHRFEAATVKSRLRAVSGALSMLPSMNAGLGHASSVDLDQSYPTHCEIVCLNESTTAHLEARNTPADPFPSRFAPQPSATNGALLRLQTRHSWFDPRSFRQQAYNYKVSTKTSRDISKWLEPASSTPILILVDPHDITASLSKVTHSFCAANEPPTKWFIIPCFSFPAPRKPTVPFRRPMFLDLLISIVAGLLPVHRTLNSLANDAEQLEALSKENVHLACGLALKMISDLLGQLTGSFLILIDEFSRFNDASVGETGELWTKLLSALAKCNEKENRLVRVFVRTKHRSRALDFAGTLQSVVMAGSQSLATVPLKKLVQERLL